MSLRFDRAKIGKSLRLGFVGLLCAGLAACATTSHSTKTRKHGKEYFAESEYGVKASPRVYTGRNVPKGGGRLQLGKPYKVRGKWYVPKEDYGYNKNGLASWYGSAFHGRLTANGEVYDQYHLSAAHPTFPLPSYARVTNLTTGTSVIVRVNDRGPYHAGRIIDLSGKAAEMLDVKNSGTAKVNVQYVGRARMDGRDMPYLMASYRTKGQRGPGFEPQIATGVMVASNETSIGLPDPDNNLSTATALTNDNGQTQTKDTFAMMGEFPELPMTGPIPRERPYANYNVAALGDQAVSGYAEFRLDQAHTPFDAVLVAQGAEQKLTAEKIRDAWRKHGKDRR